MARSTAHVRDPAALPQRLPGSKLPQDGTLRLQCSDISMLKRISLRFITLYQKLRVHFTASSRLFRFCLVSTQPGPGADDGPGQHRCLHVATAGGPGDPPQLPSHRHRGFRPRPLSGRECSGAQLRYRLTLGHKTIPRNETCQPRYNKVGPQFSSKLHEAGVDVRMEVVTNYRTALRTVVCRWCPECRTGFWRSGGWRASASWGWTTSPGR